jgi:hypothetical protein
MNEVKLRAVTPDQWQRRRMKLPKRDLKMPDGRVLRKVIGYDLSKMATNKATRDAFLESAGWQHLPSGLVVSAGVEDTERFGPLLHISMSYHDHDPTWEEIKALRYIFFPKDMDVMMVLPKDTFYVNIHPHCFHLWQSMTSWDVG